MFSNYVPVTEIVFRIDKDLSKLSTKKTNNPVSKKGAEALRRKLIKIFEW